MTRVRFRSRFKLTYGRRSKRLHPYPACAAAVAQENETLLELGIEAKSNFGSFTWDPPGPIGARDSWEAVAGLRSSSFHHGPFDDHAGGDIFPQRHKQLARQSDDGRLLHAAAVAFDPFMEPAR